MYTAITCLLSLLLLLLRVVNCGILQPAEQEEIQQDSSSSIHSKGTDSSDGNNHRDRLLVYSDPQCDAFYKSNFILGLLIVSLLFLIFTISMGYEQLDAVETGKGKIARMKMSVGASGTEFARVSEEFNEMFGGNSPHPTWHWFLPLTVTFPRGMKKVVLGYDWDETTPSAPYEDSESSTGDHEMEELERGNGIIRENRPTSPLVASSPPLPQRSAAGLDRASSHGSAVSLEAGGVKNRRPRSLDGPMEIV